VFIDLFIVAASFSHCPMAVLTSLALHRSDAETFCVRTFMKALYGDKLVLAVVKN
jgi:hypothetical protein